MRAYVADEAAAERSMQVGSPTDQVVIHLARGELAQAGEMITEQRLLDPMNAHLRVLDTELTRMQGTPSGPSTGCASWPRSSPTPSTSR